MITGVRVFKVFKIINKETDTFIFKNHVRWTDISEV